jgi:hypothetical protein
MEHGVASRASDPPRFRLTTSRARGANHQAERSGLADPRLFFESAQAPRLATSRCKIALPSREQTEPGPPKQNNQILFGIVSVA